MREHALKIHLKLLKIALLHESNILLDLYPKVVAYLSKDRKELLAFYNFPAEIGLTFGLLM